MQPTLLRSPVDAARFLSTQACRALCTDSRALRTGDAFLAWPGRRSDGRRHVGRALADGAAACLVEADGAAAFGFDDARIATYAGLQAAAGDVAAAFHGHPSARLDLLASTGTNGKTSTTWWAAQALTALGRRAGLIGTLGIGEPGAALATVGLTTPDAVALQGALADFVQRGFKACAIEASSIGIVEHRLAGTQIAVALFTNLTQDHLDHHGTMEAYWAAKRVLFSWPGLRAAVVNIDDAHGVRLAAELRAQGLPLWTVSLRGPARLQALDLRHQGAGMTFDVLEGVQRVPGQVALVGDYNASNLLLVTGGLRALGLPLADIAAVLPHLTPVPGRLQPVTIDSAGDGAGLPRVLVDYAHTPDALDQVLQALRPLAAARGCHLWCLFGCGGNRYAGKRPLMGAVAERRSDQVLLTSDNPRDEPPSAILAQVLDGMLERSRVIVIEDRGQAIAHAVAHAGAHDVLLLAGKGHEDYQETAGVRRHFVDAEVAAQALRQRLAALAGTRAGASTGASAGAAA